MSGLRIVKDQATRAFDPLSVCEGSLQGDGVFVFRGSVAFRSADCSGGRCGFDVGVLEQFLCGKASSLDFMVFDDYTTCKCKLHTKVICGIKNGTGCSAKREGTLGVLRAIYSPGVNYCHAEPFVRVADASFVTVAINLSVTRASYMGSPDSDVQGLLSGGFTTPEQWGAGYCYMPLVIGTARWRVARVLGPEPLVIDLLKVLRVCGLSCFARYQLVYVGSGVHIVRDKASKGARPDAGARIVNLLVAAVEEFGEGLRIGMDVGAGQVSKALVESRGALMKGFVDRLDVAAMFGDYVTDFALATYALGAVPMGFPGGRNRLNVLALIGDRALSLVCVVTKAEAKVFTAADVQDITSVSLSNASLARLANSCGLMDIVAVPAGVDRTAARVAGSALEAMVGCLYLHCGFGAVRNFYEKFFF